jgi:hypothetical protein
VKIVINIDLGKRREWLAQMVGSAGAGVEKGLGPAPLERADARFAEQVPWQKPHLRQKMTPPAPKDSLIFVYLHSTSPIYHDRECE